MKLCDYRLLLWLFMSVGLLLSSGCEPPPPPEGTIAIEGVAKWYQLFRAEHRGKAPKDQDEFMEFINKRLSDRPKPLTVTPEELLTSPRDGEMFEIKYGKTAGNKGIDKNIACYERTGYDGKKLVCFESAYAQELESAELERLLSEE